MSTKDIVDAAAPRLSREEELYVISITDLVGRSLGRDVGTVVSGDSLVDPQAALRLILSVLSSGNLPVLGSSPLISDASKRMLKLLGVPEGSINSSLSDVVGIVGKLSDSESKVLSDSTSVLVNKMLDKLVHRLSVSVGENSQVASSAKLTSFGR